MYIIDKHKDYYDYISHVYGMDKTTTFDRRGSCELSHSELIKRVIGLYMIKTFDTHAAVNWKYCEKQSFIFEAGYIQYCFVLDNIRRKLTKNTAPPEYIYDADIILKRVYSEENHLGKKELSIFVSWTHTDYSHYRHKHLTWWREWESNSLKNGIEIPDKSYSDYCIELPILKNTKIPASISAEDIWKNISTFISSKYNDKTVDIKLTDVEKAINHGFDKRESFRPFIKPLQK
jgi:hypothetical protein